MKKIKLFVVFVLMGVSLKADYCIQVLTANQNERHFIVNKASSGEYAAFNDVRVESRGHYLVFRIGDYKRYNDARNDITRIRETARDAYIRKCDFIKDKVVFIANEREENSYYEEPKSYSTPIQDEEPKTRVRKPSLQNVQGKGDKRKKYKKREELISPYIKKENSLWNDCKKCFVPVYEDEEDEEDSHGSDNIQKEPKKVHVKKNIPKQESFWVEDIPIVKTSTAKSKRKKRIKNKFDIDERFLP